MFKTALLLTLSAFTIQAAEKNLEIYWIDAEGGAATLIVSPSGEFFFRQCDVGLSFSDARNCWILVAHCVLPERGTQQRRRPKELDRRRCRAMVRVIAESSV